MYRYQKLIINKKLNLRKNFRILIKNVNELTNIFNKISKIKNQNNFKNFYSIIIIKNYNKIVNSLKRHLENNVLNKKIISIFQRKK